MAKTSVGQIGLDLVVNQNKFNKQMSGITNLAKKAGAVLAGAFAVKKIADFGKSCLDLGSDLAEVQNVVDVTFPSMTARVDEFAKSAITSFGLSETMAKRYSAMFGTMAKQFGFSERAAFDMGTTLAGLAGDVASFYDMTQDEAYTKLKAVFSGETEVLKDIGVVMTQSALDAYAMANGFGKTTQAMSEAEKVALRYQFVQDKLAAAQGDFSRTSGSWANQVRILNLQFDSLKATIGQGLINLFTPVIRVINAIIGKLATLANAFKSFTELITGNKSTGSSGSSIADMGVAATDAGTGLENASGAADNMASSANKAGNAAKKAAKEMRALMGFDQINKLSEQTEDSADSGDAGGSGGGGSASGLGSAVDFGSLAQGETVIDEVGNKFAKMFENIKTLCEPAIQSLKRLWSEGLAKLGNFVWTALKDFYNGFLVPVGKWALGTGIPRFIDALNNGLNKVNWSKINASLRGLWDALAPFAIKVGEGLLWLWENVLVPLGTWTASEVVPRFLDTLSIGIEGVNRILEALQPLFQWFWDGVLQPLAQWTGGKFLQAWDGINGALQIFSDWCAANPGTIQGITITVGSFFAAWKMTELMSFVEQSGGVIAALGRIATALMGTTAAKIADKAETLALNALYAKDFAVGIAKGTAALLAQAKQWALNTAAKYADEAAMAGVSVAEVAWQSVMSSSIAQMALRAAAWVKETALKVADTAAQVAMTAATVAWNAVCAIATAATTAFGAAIAFLTSPIGLVIAAIAALIAAGVLVWKNWDVIKEKAMQIWGALKEWLHNTIEAIKEFFYGLWKGIKETFANVGNWFKEKFTLASTGVKNAFSGTKKFFADIWTGIKNTFGNVTQWFRDKFSAAWKAVKDVFSSGGQIFEGIKDGILSSLKSVINGLIDGINNVITIPFNGINSALDSLRNMSMHIGPYSISPFNWLPSIGVPQIPHLAQGGFVKANTPQLAMIGDNRHQGEVVAPEDKLREMAMETAKAAGAGGVTREELESIINRAVMRIVAALADMGFYLDGRQLATAEQAAREGISRQFNNVGFV